ncbi:type 1 glutamine amidotransferase [Mycetocola sp. CAN_C7]|uniref:ThuA domain-containing protein n=1 Tax=Mycetocola sp. CAN_C7 TaxID=2787724 RepID=UPI001A2BAA8A
MTNDHKTALVVRGGWDGHQPVEATELFIPYLKASGFEVRVEESPKIYADTDYMAGVDLVTQCMTMSTIEKDEFEGLRTAVENGTGLAGWHGGIADSRGHIITTGTDFYRLKTTRQAQKG